MGIEEIENFLDLLNFVMRDAGTLKLSELE